VPTAKINNALGGSVDLEKNNATSIENRLSMCGLSVEFFRNPKIDTDVLSSPDEEKC
jgi:hypothetical protein